MAHDWNNVRMAEHKVSRSIVIDAPAARVFDLLSDPSRHHEFDGSGTVRDSTFGPERLTEDAEFGMNMRMFGVSYRMVNRVVDFEKDRRVAWKTAGPQRWCYELEELPEGGTRVTETFDYSRGPWFVHILLGVPAKNAAAMERTLLRLRELTETR